MPSIAGLAVVRGTVGMAVVPGTFAIRVQTGAGPTFVELAGADGLAELLLRGATRRSAKHRMFIERIAETRPAVRAILGSKRCD